ncbi:DnaD domain-containing protein [Halalkalibacterium ligniniphilum]|uniref:DnaD domain-containing protein n=1 Tax=Halalkalibacterium ligniniphilum TaxID=1134413 RepID=UPI0003458977|nr:DnaD domain-containing protein [Halalkalibacterium ligniniphilum]
MDQTILTKWVASGQLSISKLLLQHYSDLDLNEEELVVLLHIQTFIEAGDHFPTPEHLASRMTLNATACSELLGRTIKKGCLSLEKRLDDNGVSYEFFSLAPLWERLAAFIGEKEQEQKLQKQQEMEANVYRLFEQEFSRPLSPIEGETLTMWLDQDHHSPELIRAALREAVVSGKLNFRYIDRILFEWKRNGIKTLDQAKAYGEKFRAHQLRRKPEQERAKAESFPSYNWLEQ